MKEMFAESDGWRAASLSVVILAAIGIFLYSLSNPREQWDMLGYAASVASLETNDPAAVHAGVYEDLKKYATAEDFQRLTESTDYRLAMHNDAEAFWQQIPFYKIRLLIILILLLLSKAGIGIFEAMHVLSAVFSTAGFLLIFFALRQYIHSLFWILSPWLFYEFGQSLDISRAGGVDAFAFFWCALTCVGFVRKSRWLMPVLALSVLVRTDLIIHTMLMFAAIYWLQRDTATLKYLAKWLVVAVLLYVGLTQWSGNYGWYAVFFFVFISDLTATHPEIYSNAPFNLELFLAAYHNVGWISPWLWVTSGCAVLSWSLSYKFIGAEVNTNDQHRDPTLRLVVVGAISVAYVAIHYMLFPALYMRFFVGQYYFMTLALFAICSYQYRLNQFSVKSAEAIQPN